MILNSAFRVAWGRLLSKSKFKMPKSKLKNISAALTDEIKCVTAYTSKSFSIFVILSFDS